MADIKVELKNSLNSKIYPKTTLDNIVKSVASGTTLIASGGVIKKDFLDLTGLISASYVSSANVIPTSAINGLSTAITNGASSYVVSSAVAKSNVTSNYNDIKSANEVTTKIPNAYAVREFLSDYDEIIKEYIDSTCQPSSTLSAGFGINIVEGSTISLARTRPITTIPSTSTSVTLQPGEAYIIDATTTSKTLNVGSVPSGHFGLESHMEIFVANTGYIVAGTNVVLAQPLEPDSVNNCTIRFHDGFAIISVEDHVAGYIVVSSGSASNTSGTLAYGLTSASSNYIAFDGRLNGSVITFGGVTVNGKKHVVGNGYDNTILTGSVNCGASKFTVANLSIQNITVNGGVITLGDAYALGVNTLNGAKIAVEHARLGEGVFIAGGTYTAITSGGVLMGPMYISPGENVSGNATIDLSGTRIVESAANTYIEGVTLINGSGGTGSGGAFVDTGNNVSTTLRNVTFSNCFVTSPGRGGAAYFPRPNDIVESCTFLYNSGYIGGAIYRAAQKTSCTISSCIISGNTAGWAGGGAYHSGHMDFYDCVFMNNTARGGGGGGLAFSKAGGNNIIKGCIFSGNSTQASTADGVGGGIWIGTNASAIIEDCVISGNVVNSARSGGGIYINGNVTISNSLISGNAGQDDMYINSNGLVTLTGSTAGTVAIAGGTTTILNSNTINRVSGNGYITISSGASITLTSGITGAAITIPAGAVVKIIGGDGTTSAYLSELALTGTTITNVPSVLGATVTVPATGGPWDVYFADNTTSTYSATGTARQVVLAGAVTYIGGQ